MPRGVHVLPSASTSTDRVVRSIDAAVRETEPDIILPVFEETLFRIWDESPDWLPRVHPVIQPEHRALFRDKHAMVAFLGDRGVLVPRTVRLTNGSRAEIDPIVRSLGLPVVVKGGSGAGGSRVRIAGSIDDAFGSVTELHQRTGEVPALQEFVDGTVYIVGGVFYAGRPVRLICGEVLEMHPLRTGPAILMVSRYEEELVKVATDVFRSLSSGGRKARRSREGAAQESRASP